MGCLNSKESDVVLPEDVVHNHQTSTSEGMTIQRKQEEEKVKYLLLGAGESGKSTIFKQMRELYGAPMTDDQLKVYGVIIRANIKTIAKDLCVLIRLLKIDAHELDEYENKNTNKKSNNNTNIEKESATSTTTTTTFGSKEQEKEEKDESDNTAAAAAAAVNHGSDIEKGIESDATADNKAVKYDNKEEEKEEAATPEDATIDDVTTIITPSQAYNTLVSYLVDESIPFRVTNKVDNTFEKSKIYSTHVNSDEVRVNDGKIFDWVGHCASAGFGPNKDAEETLLLWKSIKALWQSKLVQDVIWKKRALVNIIDGHKVFLDDIEHIVSPQYKPYRKHSLLARTKTTKVHFERYKIGPTNFEMWDVGGQRAFRGNWYDSFNNVTGIIFVAAVSEYDQSLCESKNTNRIVESLELFHSMCHNRAFSNVPIILFLNKIDIFKEKIQYSNIVDQIPFADYAGRPQNYEDGLDYFKQKFRNVLQFKSADNDNFIHICTATDTTNVQKLMDATRTIITNENLRLAGFGD